MPEAYTHIRIARAALGRSGQAVADAFAFEMGANGPDPLFAYQALSAHRAWDLPALGSRLHTQQCGAFLRALVFRAWTPAQRSYVLGFLTHYAADAVLHPYIAALCREDAPFARPHGHGFCEVALDSYWHAQDTGSPAVPAQTAAPALYGAPLAEVTALLQAALLEVYGQAVPLEALADAFHDFRTLHQLFCAPGKGKRALVWAAERLVLHSPGMGLSHLTPAAPPKGGFPAEWVDPFTGEPHTTGPDQLLDEAQTLAAQYIKAACCYWQGLGTKDRLAAQLGDRSYITGLLSEPALPLEQESTGPESTMQDSADAHSAAPPAEEQAAAPAANPTPC